MTFRFNVLYAIKNKETSLWGDYYKAFNCIMIDDAENLPLVFEENPSVTPQTSFQLRAYSYHYYLFNQSEISLLDFAAFYGSVNCFKWLMLNGCEYGYRTAAKAAAGGNMEIIILLMNKRAYEVKHSLDESFKYHRHEITNYILSLNKRSQINLHVCLSSFNFTDYLQYFDCLNSAQFEAAITCGHIQLTKYFIDNKFNVNGQSKNGFTFLMTVASLGNYEMAKFLIDHGADANASNNDGSPLYFAAYGGFYKIVKLLVEHGADIEKSTQHQETPLMAACETNLKTVQYLVEQGANLQARDDYKCTALHVAARENKKDIVEYLVSQGAKTHVRNETGYLPGQLSDNPEIREMLGDDTCCSLG